MDDCCGDKALELGGLATKQRKVLWTVLFINALMFVIECGYGIAAHSTSLLADSLDMLGDAFVYGISLFVLGKSLRWNASVSLLKGMLMAVFGVGVITQAAIRFSAPSLPIAETMGWVGAAALLANAICAVLLLRHRNDDINMRSTWLCSRNDVIANLGVLLAAAAVAKTQSKYPDLFVGIIISVLVLKSAFQVLQDSIHTIRKNPA